MTRSLNCFFINVNSLVSLHKRHFLGIFLEEHRPDLVLIAEHKLSPRHNLVFAGYTIIRQNREQGHCGGTAILIRIDSIMSELPFGWEILRAQPLKSVDPTDLIWL